MLDTDSDPVSRAYFKLKEALLWSGIHVSEGDVCAELGSAPGGACQLLLEKGAQVIAIDPAELEPEVAEHPKLTHIRRRGHEVKKRDFREVRWLFADINMVPKYTLDTVSEIVAHDSVDIKGMALTLKLANWDLLDSVPKWIRRVKDLGFKYVRTRQLAFNRQEICLIAAKDKFVLRSGKKKTS
jgi:23S rRNA (cytidine2498-2'-O)-methyltransferase